MDAERAVLCSDADTEKTEATEAEDADATDAEDADATDEELLALAACDAKSCAAVGSKLPATCGPPQARSRVARVFGRRTSIFICAQPGTSVLGGTVPW
jgi:hypothetical protein